jgi:hypothetical protein
MKPVPGLSDLQVRIDPLRLVEARSLIAAYRGR